MVYGRRRQRGGEERRKTKDEGRQEKRQRGRAAEMSSNELWFARTQIGLGGAQVESRSG